MKMHEKIHHICKVWFCLVQNYMLALFPMKNYSWVQKRWMPLFLCAADQRKLKVAWVIGLSKEIFLMLTWNSSPSSEEELKTTSSSPTVSELSSISYSSSSRSSMVTWKEWHCIFTELNTWDNKLLLFLQLHGHLGILNGRLLWGKRPNQILCVLSIVVHVQGLDQPDVVDRVWVLLGLLCHGGIASWGSLLIGSGWLGGVHVLCLTDWNNKRPLNGVLVACRFPLFSFILLLADSKAFLKPFLRLVQTGQLRRLAQVPTAISYRAPA